MTEIMFTIQGEPIGQGRPRFSTSGGFAKAYDPDKSRNYKAFARLIALQTAKKMNWKCSEQPVSVTIKAYLSIPISSTKKFKAAAAKMEVYPTKKPDVDNIFKSITDALSGIIYKDDRQIVRSTITKNYSDLPRVEVFVQII